MANGGDEPVLDGTYIRICYTRKGVKHTAYAMARNGAISWKPPKGVSSVYFRANDATKDGALIINGKPVRLVPCSPLESPSDYVDIVDTNGTIEGTAIQSQAVHNILGFKYELLQPDVYTLALLTEEDTPLEVSPKLRQMLDRQKSRANASAAGDRPKCTCPLLWHFFHARARGHKRREANFQLVVGIYPTREPEIGTATPRSSSDRALPKRHCHPVSNRAGGLRMSRRYRSGWFVWGPTACAERPPRCTGH